MQYIQLKEKLKDFLVFSTNDILKIDPDFHKQRLSEWQKKGYITKIAKEYYLFSDTEINEAVLFTIANTIYPHSYISLEMAFSYYHLIPESVYSITSVTSQTTRSYATPAGNFTYRKIKPCLMFGYRLVEYKNHNFKIAEIEKAILDYFYSNPRLASENEFVELRFNADSFRSQVKMEKMAGYLAQFKNKALEKRINKFIDFIYHA
jgi:predicted transcriptional regulator of viral defense system